MLSVQDVLWLCRQGHARNHDPRFLRQIEKPRTSLRAGRGVRVEDVDSERWLGERHHLDPCEDFRGAGI